MRYLITRRRICQLGIAGIVSSLFPSELFVAHAHSSSGIPDLERRVKFLLSCVTPPTFPNQYFPITQFGAVGDGTTDNTGAFKQAITACSQAGGGHVVVPAGTFLTGAIHLLSNVDLHLEAGSTIKFSQDPQAYLPVVYTRWQGIELMNYSPFIYAYGQQNIGITGSGTIDGQADSNHWWSFKPLENTDFTALEQMADQGIPVADRIFGAGHYLPPALIEPYRCQNVLIQGVTLINTPFWQMHPTLCQNVTIDGVTANSLGPNNDGCDPESCNGVIIQNCTFNTGDDCIAIKSGRNTDGRRVNTPCQNILIQNSHFQAGHGGVTIGSEMTGGVQNVIALNLQMNSPTLNNCLRIKTNSVRGGFVKDILMANVTVGQVVQAAIDINFYYGEGDSGTFLPTVTNIAVTKLTVSQAKQAWNLQGYTRDPIGTVSLTDCTFNTISSANTTQNVADLRLKNVTINGKPVTHG